jgi:hypothetical protein
MLSKLCPLTFALCFLFAAPLAAAQETREAQRAPATAGEEAPTASEAIIVEGIRRDRAMDAFLRGDFVTAEIEFKENLHCIERREMLQDFAAEQAVADAVSAQLSLASGAGGASFGNVGDPQAYNLPDRPERIAERTCYSPEWQSYMIGLSQIQLGKLDEAKRSLYIVARRSNDDFLFDAHFRVGLLELLDGNVDGAERRLSRMQGLLRSCISRGCEVRNDLQEETEYLQRAVAAARAGARR